MNLALVTNKPYKNSETFIKAQADLLPFSVNFFYGFKLPLQYENMPVYANTFYRKVKNHLIKEDVIKKTGQLFFKKNIDVVLAEYGMTGTLVLPVCKKLNIPLIVHFHGHDAVRKTILEAYGKQYIEMFNYASKIISVSHEMTKRLIKIGCPENKIVYNPYGPNDSFLELEPKYSKKQFVSIGRFVEKKAPHLTILAFNDVIKKHPDARLVMAGNGVLLDSSKDLVTALGIERNIIFPGYITPKDFKDLLKESVAFIQHSIEAQDGDMEGTPVAILEANAAGLPVVSTYHAGIPDVIIHKETGLLSKERDIKGMANNMLWILEHKDEAMKMGKKGKARIASNFSMKQHIKNLSDIIRSVTSQ
jgi:glycosyltransferase involved in cell wall biosynthesis